MVSVPIRTGISRMSSMWQQGVGTLVYRLPTIRCIAGEKILRGKPTYHQGSTRINIKRREIITKGSGNNKSLKEKRMPKIIKKIPKMKGI